MQHIRTALGRDFPPQSSLRWLRIVSIKLPSFSHIALPAALSTHGRRSLTNVATQEAVSTSVDRTDNAARDQDEPSIPTSAVSTSDERNEAAKASLSLVPVGDLKGKRRTKPMIKTLISITRYNWHSESGKSMIAKHKDDLNFWAALLKIRRRRDGAKGIRAVWDDMQRHGVEVPVSDETRTDKFWQSFAAAVPRATLMTYAWERARRSGRLYDKLYLHVMRRALVLYNPMYALEIHSDLLKIGFSSKGFLKSLIKPALVRAFTFDRVFRALYTRSSDRSIYDELMPALCERGLYSQAYRWHRFLVAHEDLPTKFSSGAPLLRYFKNRNMREDYEPYQQILRDLEGLAIAPPRSEAPPSDEPQDTLEADRRISPILTLGLPDRWAARAFATTSWSLDTVIKMLSSLGMKGIGPLALRELAARCETAAELLAMVAQLEQRGIAVMHTVFSSLLLRFAADNDVVMMRAVYESDLHPDVYEEEKTQAELLSHYMAVGDHNQAHRTLIVLSVFHNVPLTTLWNRLLVERMEVKDWKAIEAVIDDMTKSGIDIHRETIRALISKLLRRRVYSYAFSTGLGGRPWKRPPSKKSGTVHDLEFVSKMLLKIYRAGRLPGTWVWRYPLKYLGMELRLGELEKIILWLVVLHYDRMNRTDAYRYGKSRFNSQGIDYGGEDYRDNDLSLLISPPLVEAMIVWGIKTLGKEVPKESQRSPLGTFRRDEYWKRPLLLLKMLQEEYQVTIHKEILRKGCKLGLRILFGDRESARLENRFSREDNRDSIADIVKFMNDLFELWDIPPEDFEDEALLRQNLVLNTQPVLDNKYLV